MKASQNMLYRIVKPIYYILIKILYHPKIEAKEKIPSQGPAVIACNHKMAFDPLLVMISTKREVSYLAKKELFRYFHGWVFRKMGMIPVDRAKKNPKAILEAEKKLKEGGLIGIFPEGKRNRTEKDLLSFHTGAVRLAKQAGCPIVPAGISGRYLPIGGKLLIQYGEPIDVSKMEITEANEYLQEEIRKLLRK